MSKKKEKVEIAGVKFLPPSMTDYFMERDTAMVLQRLYNVKQRLYRPASAEMGVHHEILKRKLIQLKKKGFSVRPLFNYKLLGLEMVSAIFEGDKASGFIEKPFVRSISRIYPTGDTLVVFYVPRENINVFKAYLRSLEGVKSVEQVIYRTRSTPDFIWYGLKLADICSKESFEKLKYATERDIGRYSFRANYPLISFAAIDLAIMAVLEREWIPPPPVVVARKAGYRERSVKYHYDEKVRKFISGYGVFFKPYNVLGPIFVQALKWKSEDVVTSIAKNFAQHPFISGVTVMDTGRVYITYTGPPQCTAKITNLASSFLEHKDLYVVEIVKSYTLPAIKGLEYDPHKRYWSFDIEKVMKDYE